MTTPAATSGDVAPVGSGPVTLSADAVNSAAAESSSTHAAQQMNKKGNAKAKLSGNINKKKAPTFAALSAKALAASRHKVRKVPVPPHRQTPMRAQWMQIYEPIVKHLKLQIRMNLRTKSIDLKAGKATNDVGALQKGVDFVKAVVLGFSVADAVAIIRLDDLYVESFEVKDIRSTLKGDHLARAVGRIAGKDGRTKFTIENATKTRIVVADTKIHLLGSFENIRLARHSISSLVLGTAPGKVYNKLRTVSARLNEKKF